VAAQAPPLSLDQVWQLETFPGQSWPLAEWKLLYPTCSWMRAAFGMPLRQWRLRRSKAQ